MIKKLLVFAIFFIAICNIGNAQVPKFGWAGNIGVSRHNNEVGDIKNSNMIVDKNGNIYIIGYFYDSVDFDPGIKKYYLKSNGGSDIFISKLNAYGDLIWAKRFGGVNNDYGEDIALDFSGEIVATGRYTDSIKFKNNKDTFNFFSKINENIFLIKLDDYGEVKWAKSSEGTSQFKRIVLKIDHSQNIVVTGNFNSKCDFNLGKDSFFLTANGGGYYDVFNFKTDKDGGFIWAVKFGGKFHEYNTSIEIDKYNNILMCGHYVDTVDFNPGNDTFIIYSKKIKLENAYVLKLDSNGQFNWVKSFENYANLNEGIEIDSSGNIYLTGVFGNNVDFNPGIDTFLLSSNNLSPDIYFVKLNSQGDFIWAKKIGGMESDYGKAIITDDSGYVYIAGRFSNTIDFDEGKDTFILKECNNLSTGWGDIFITKYDSIGNFIWAKSVGAAHWDYIDNIELDQWKNIYINGMFYEKFEANPGLDSFFLYPTQKGRYDIFIIKLLQCEDSKSSINETTCNLYLSPSGKLWDTSGTYTDTIYNSAGCDSIITISLTILNSTTDTINPSVCYSYISPSGKYIWDTSGIYSDTLVNYVGCDSIIEINLVILQSSASNFSKTVCDKYISPSGKYTWINSGIYYDTIINQAGCDSIMEINLRVLNSSYSNISKSVCENYISPSGKILTSSDIYYDTIPNQAGCDSIIQINLEVLKHTSSIINIVGCASYISPSGKIWNTSGTYYDTIQNNAGCDSFMTIHLKIQNSFSTILVSSCYSYTSPSGKYIWNSSGTYYDTIQNNSGCDSFITIKLNILESTKSYVSISSCNKFISPSGKYTWYFSGIHFDTIPNQAGCDSFITVNLKSLKTYSSISETVCDSYISPSGKILTSSNVYYDTISNQVGCDSIIEIDLTILKKSYSLTNITTCKSYTSPSGKYTWTKSGMYADTVQNQAGCDSIIGINLIINNADISVAQSGNTLTANATNSNYQWLDCNQNFAIISGETSQQFIAQNNGDYAVSITQNNCTDTSVCYAVTNANIDNKPNFKYQIYPNPSKGIFTIEVSENSKMKVYDGIGKLVYEKDNMGKTSQHDLTKLANGIYYIQLSNSKGIITENLVIEK